MIDVDALGCTDRGIFLDEIECHSHTVHFAVAHCTWPFLGKVRDDARLRHTPFPSLGSLNSREEAVAIRCNEFDRKRVGRRSGGQHARLRGFELGHPVSELRVLSFYCRVFQAHVVQ
jgi:hypothetical protein